MSLTSLITREDNLRKLLYPKNIAIIGATDKSTSVGRAIFHNLLFGGYKGILYPVHPKSKSVSGVKAYAEVNNIDDEVDLAVIVVPRDSVANVLRQCGEKGITVAIVITAGFREIGPEGMAMEDELISIANQYQMALLGPNCFGIINTDKQLSMNATFARTIPSSGNVAFISQSGSAGAYALEYAAANNIGLSKFVSIGNKAVLNENDFLRSFADDESTKVILAYIEHFENAPEFMRIAKEITTGKNPKPILVIKSGRSKSGHRAAASHTGALVERDDLLDHLFRQFGIIRVSTMEALFNLARCFADQPLPKGNNIAIITNAGGPAIISCDESEKYGINVPELNEKTQQQLKAVLPMAVSVKNPLDLIGDADAKRYELTLKAVLQSKDIDMIQVLAIPQMMNDLEDIASAVTKYASEAKTRGKPLVSSFAGFGKNEKLDQLLSSHHIPNYAFPESGVKALGAMAEFSAWARKPKEEPKKFEIDKALAEKIISIATSEDRHILTQPESYALFEAYGFTAAKYKVVKSADEAVNAANAIGYPIAMKIISPDVIHKFDWGGVKINVNDPKNAKAAYEEIIENIRSKDENARIDGVLVQEMIPPGVELIVGAIKNINYGHILAFGLGGTFVEIFKDISFRLAPITRSDAGEMMREIKSYDILCGYRGMPARDTDALADLLQRLSQLVVDFPQISEIDLNPVIALEKGARIADVRVLLE
ncbi:MAG: acetate--CoA ligase family protein [Candidatus Cyclobacteriaceae bacterium M2_1C_046]